MLPWYRLGVLPLTWLLLARALLARGDAVDAPGDACIRAAPRQFTDQQIHRLCESSSAVRLGDGPAICAKRAVSASMRSSSVNKELIGHVIELCRLARDDQPAECWVAVPMPSFRSREWMHALASVCQEAVDSAPSTCLLEFKQHGFLRTANSQSQSEAIDVIIQICKHFKGQIATIKKCVNQAPRSLPELQRYTLCRDGDPEGVDDVIACAKQLAQRSVDPATVAHVCATAANGRDSPEQCVLAAQQQLRWMDADAVGHLCQHSTGSTVPVTCASQLRSRVLRDVSAAERSRAVLELARLCQRVSDHTVAVQCVKSLPESIFSAKQIASLCGGDTHSPQSRADCVVYAKRELYGPSRTKQTTELTREQEASTLLQLCAQATETDPIECLSASRSDTSLSPNDRVRLCLGGALGTSPVDCLRTIQPKILHQLPNGKDDAIELCQQATTTAPAMCLNQLHLAPSTLFRTGLAMALCKDAASVAPAECFAAAPHHYSDASRVVLCGQATSDAPAACARVSVPRVSHDQLKADLCAKAESAAPAKCASSVPFGMSAEEIVWLCHGANDSKPAECAQAVPPTLRIPWRDVATACNKAQSSTPGQCLSHHVRQRLPVSKSIITLCRSVVATAASVELAKFAYECPQLLPKCPLIVSTRVLDQYGADMLTLCRGYVYFSVKPEDAGEEQSTGAYLDGNTVAAIVNGSAIFRDVHFTRAGNYTLRLSSPGVEDAIARVHVRWNETERLEKQLCDRSFTMLQCEQTKTGNLTDHEESHTGAQAQLLFLPNRHVLSSLRCDESWARQGLGLRPVGLTPFARVYAVPRITYNVLTGFGIPTASMTSWQRLGIPEGSNRSAIRRAYHQRSLEWHPDKWSFGDIEPSFRERVDEVYTLINHAYVELLDRQTTP